MKGCEGSNLKIKERRKEEKRGEERKREERREKNRREMKEMGGGTRLVL